MEIKEIEQDKSMADDERSRCEHEASVQKVRCSKPSEEDVATMCAAFKALGEPSRMKILLALAEGEMCVYHIAEAVEGQQSAVSHQLRILRDSHIIKSRRDGKNILYSLADEHVAKIIEMSREHLSC